MQRSRRALLQRRALEKAVGKNRLYKVSLSSIIVLWGLFLLLSLWNSHGDGNRQRIGGGSQALSVNNSTWNDAKPTSSHVIKHVYADFSYQSPSAVDEITRAVKEQQTEAGKEITNALCRSESQEGNIGNSGSEKNLGRRDAPKNDRMAHAADLAFDEFKTKTINSKNKYVGVSTQGSVALRVEPGGAKYNYASSGKGAKVLDFNKECKGASHILVKDQDKYLRNPCSAEEKFVAMELSEETLVSTIQVANFEHYSSNLKEFEVYGSLVYPTDSWVKLGSFTAENVKHAQAFTLPEPKSLRYLRLNLLNHYGSEFYCTLSSIEVYGVDVVEWMLEDLISASPDNNLHSSREIGESLPIERDDVDGGLFSEPHSEGSDEPNPAEQVNHHQVGRMPGDSVLKILMQKVLSLDLNLSVLERYLEELNSRYRSIFKEFDEEMGTKDLVLERTRLDIKSFLNSKDAIIKDVAELHSWKSQVTMQMDEIIKDNIILRSEVRKVKEKQMFMESKGIIVFMISMSFGIIALTMLSIHTVLNICRSDKPRKFWSTHLSWVFLLLSCITIIIILSL